MPRPQNLPLLDGADAEQLNVRVGAGKNLVVDVQRLKVVRRIHDQLGCLFGNTIFAVVFRAGFLQLRNHGLVRFQKKRFPGDRSA